MLVQNEPSRIWLVILVESIFSGIAILLGAKLFLYYQAHLGEQQSDEGSKGVGVGPTDFSEALI